MFGLLVGKYGVSVTEAKRASPNMFFVVSTDDMLSSRYLTKEMRKQKRYSENPKAKDQDALYAFAKKHGA